MTYEWNHSTINDVCVLVTDGSHSSPKSVNDGKYMVSVKDFTDYGFDFASCRMISNDDYETLKRNGCVPQIDDILIGKDGARFFEDIIIYRQREKPALLSSIAILRCDKSKILPDFLYYVLRTPSFRQDVKDNYGSGSAIPRIILKDFKRMMVSYPSLEKQQAIISVLTAIDSKIQANTEINDNLYEMVNAYYTLLFKDVECEMTTIGNYAERIYSGGTPTTSNAAYWDGAFGWFSSGETRNRFVISTEKTITQAGIDNSSTKLAAKHDIVMASAGQGFTRGQTSMLLIDTYVNQSVIVIHAERKVLPYLFWNLANRYEELRAISDSSSIRGSLTTKMIAAFEIPLANEESLQAFADFSWSVIPQIENNLLENERLAALRDNLLPKLMSGEIDVSAVQL